MRVRAVAKSCRRLGKERASLKLECLDHTAGVPFACGTRASSSAARADGCSTNRVRLSRRRILPLAFLGSASTTTQMQRGALCLAVSPRPCARNVARSRVEPCRSRIAAPYSSPSRSARIQSGLGERRNSAQCTPLSPIQRRRRTSHRLELELPAHGDDASAQSLRHIRRHCARPAVRPWVQSDRARSRTGFALEWANRHDVRRLCDVDEAIAAARCEIIWRSRQRLRHKPASPSARGRRVACRRRSGLRRSRHRSRRSS